MNENEKDYQYRHISNVDKKGRRTDVTDVEFGEDAANDPNKTKEKVRVTDGVNRYRVSSKKNENK